MVPPFLKELVVQPYFLENFHPVSNLPFVEKVVVLQLQRALEEVNYLESFQSGFRS